MLIITGSLPSYKGDGDWSSVYSVYTTYIIAAETSTCINTIQNVTHIFNAETVTYINAAETSNCMNATGTVTCMIATEIFTNITITESTICIVEIEPQNLHNCNRYCDLHNCHKECHFHSSNRNCHLQNWLYKILITSIFNFLIFIHFTNQKTLKQSLAQRLKLIFKFSLIKRQIKTVEMIVKIL